MNFAATLIENVKGHAQRTPDKIFAKILYASSKTDQVSYGQLLQRSGEFAQAYREVGVLRQQAIVIILKHSPELLYAFVGALLLGAIPSIFAQPSSKVPADRYSITLKKMLDVCKTPFIVTYRNLAKEIKDNKLISDSCTVIVIGEQRNLAQFKGTEIPYYPDEIALLQHSSGTTGLKKGVALSNRSVMNQIEHYAKAIKLSSDDKVASWLPLYHDMGLIACFILPLVTGTQVAMLSPFDWIAKPISILRLIAEERSTLCWMPNFAFHLLGSRVKQEDLLGLDLSHTKAFINCAEPISAESFSIFIEKFAAVGVKEEMLSTCYAMAENTYAVTQAEIGVPVTRASIDRGIFANQHRAVSPEDASKKSRELISSGVPIDANHVKIIDNSGSELPERSIGEIAIRSDSMLTEYYHRPDLSKAAVHDGWYLTRDLGFFIGKELFVTGRKNDLIIVAGKNIYPQDVEDQISEIIGVYPGRVVAFGVYNEDRGTEEVVAIAESTLTNKMEITALKLAAAKRVADELECTLKDIIIVPHMTLVKSSSGKISRSGNRDRYMEGESS